MVAIERERELVDTQTRDADKDEDEKADANQVPAVDYGRQAARISVSVCSHGSEVSVCRVKVRGTSGVAVFLSFFFFFFIHDFQGREAGCSKHERENFLKIHEKFTIREFLNL